MPSIKIYPPSRLPDSDVTETQFNMWQEELEVYLSQEADYKVFLPDKLYSTWSSYEENRDRIRNLKPRDITAANDDAARGRVVTPEEAEAENDDKLDTIRVSLRTVLSIIGKCVSEGHYNSVVRHSTSLNWIYDMLRSDYDIQSKGVHFLNILDAKYDSSKHTPVSFYNFYRTIISNNLAKTGDVIKYKNNEALTHDEKFSPMLEDIILLDVVREIDPRLPSFVKTHYFHKMKKEERLMDFKTDILINVPHFLEQIEANAEVVSLNAIRQPQFRGRTNRNRTRKPAQQSAFCRFCYISKMPREIFTSHNFGDPRCTTLSPQDRQTFLENAKLSNIKEEEDEEPEVDLEESAEMYGYGANNDSESNYVKVKQSTNHSFSNTFSRNEDSRLNYIQPIPSQILTVFQDSQDRIPFHIDLDSGATVNFIREDEAKKCNFKIVPNGQMSRLGDGVTKLKSIGEVNLTFFRNSRKFIFNAIVCKNLTTPVIGGTPFIKTNGIEQDFVRNVIHLHNREATVQPTDPISILPEASMFANTSKVNIKTSSNLLSFKSSKVLLPGQTISVNVENYEDDLVSIEPWEQNKNANWPEPQLQRVKNGKINLCNTSIKPVTLGTDVKFCKIRNTEEAEVKPPEYYNYSPSPASNTKDSDLKENLASISLDNIKCESAREIIINSHLNHHEVFDKDLTVGYNGFYGKHECNLNWATSERPPANKVRVPNYNHNLKSLQQDLMDELTDQGVLLIPQDHNIQVQAVCPSFIQRKQRARNKAEHTLTKDDLRLLINFGPVNEKIKPVPIHCPKTDDILITLGRWKYLIIFDLFNGYFQNHMSKDAIPWLGVQTPFGGLRVMSRSGQGLAGMAEEFDELTAKILKKEIQAGMCAKIVDDCYVGGQTQEEAALNYAKVLEKLAKANIKVTPEKTHIFPKTADILGWLWKEGGLLEASPHRKLALTNTKIEDIKSIKDMRSWVGLFKTLHMVTPQIAAILSPFESATAGRESKESFEWNHDLERKFREAKESINKLVTLYLPSPDDQLILQTDASKIGLGHILYAMKDGKKTPVRIHSVKLPEKCQKWYPCELEGLALAAGVDKEFDLIRESKHPLIIETDSKPVHEALQLIKQGKFSASARISSFLTNVNRTPVISKHISGKARLNSFSDMQSRFPPDCDSEYCSIHKFLSESIESIVDDGAKNCAIKDDHTEAGYSNREAWKTAQESNHACKETKKLLSSGKPPPKALGKHSGELWNDIRQYCREATITKDGLLVVKSKPDVISGNVIRDRTVIPKPLVPALLYHIHSHRDQHPTRSQQKSIFQRQFFAIGLDKHLDLLYKNCYKCSVIEKLPKEVILNETKTMVEAPQTHFHADVVKRAQQNILTVKDHFSSFQDAVIIDSEKSTDLKNGIILLTSTMRRPSGIYVSVDNSPGFKTLLNNTDNELKKLEITFIKTDELNKNSNAVIDKGCQELEDELKRLEPEGRKISLSTLKLAVLNLNSKLRRRGNISAIEINTARDQNTGENLNLDDKELRNNQLEKRKDKQNDLSTGSSVKVGDTVRVKNKTDKHKANEIFLVTSKQSDNVGVQKILHPLTSTPGKIMSKIYQTKSKHLVPIHQPSYPDYSDLDDEENDIPVLIKEKPNSWSPINQNFYNDDESDDDHAKTDGEYQNVLKRSPILREPSEDELEWDDSPELYRLNNEFDLDHVSSENDDLNHALQPRQLFVENDEENDESITEQSNDDEVFARDDFQTPPSTPKLHRRNAIRYKQRPIIYAASEPRITRSMLSSGQFRQSFSNPTSPSEVVLNRVQNFGNILQPNNPIIPQAVDLGPVVQNVDQALINIDIEQRTRRSTRTTERVDYAKLHKYGRKQ